MIYTISYTLIIIVIIVIAIITAAATTILLLLVIIITMTTRPFISHKEKKRSVLRSDKNYLQLKSSFNSTAFSNT